jgi:hypothetical protein
MDRDHKNDDDIVADEEKQRKHNDSPSVHAEDIGFEWNTFHENLLKKWQERCEHYSKLHNLSGKYYDKLNTIISLPTKLLLTLIATIEFSQLSQVDSQSTWSFYFNGFIAILTLLIQQARDYLGWNARVTKHFNVANAYEKIGTNIEVELCNPVDKRINVRAFMRYCKNMLQNLKETSPSIPDKILDIYLNNIDDKKNAQKIDMYVKKLENNNTPQQPTENNIAIQIESNDDDTNYIQNEFISEMQKKLDEKREKLENFQLQRMNE